MSASDLFDLMRQIRVAHGYLELGMFEDACAELDEIGPAHRLRLEVVLTRMEIFQTQKRWSEGAALGREALPLHADCGPLYLVTAFAVRRSSGLEQAREILLTGSEVLQTDPMYYFNLGCYECQLGNLDEAKGWLQRAFSLDAKYRKISLTDADLEPLRDWLAGQSRESGSRP